MKIPIVFAFDDNYALPASVAIMSLQTTKAPATEYEVIVLHDGLRDETMRKFERICSIRWISVSGLDFGALPRGWSGKETWYRLVIANLLPEYDRVIWSDGDVLFKQDLAEAFAQDIGEHDWLGVCMERADERCGIHNHFPEAIDRAVYTPCFMVINAYRWRERDFLSKCKSVIAHYGEKLTFYDLDVLNLAADSIGDVSIKYSVFAGLIEAEHVEDASEYPWLERTHGRDAIVEAVRNPTIVHYAGCGARLKPWERAVVNIPRDYWMYLVESPFFIEGYFSPRLHPFFHWIVDYLQYLLTGRSTFRTRIRHWEDMIRSGRLAWLLVGFLRLRYRVNSFRRNREC